jgi:hypothetical protein
MNLFIDESGNTGEALANGATFNFEAQPYYVLTGIFIGDSILCEFSSFIDAQIKKHRIKSNELKALTLYSGKPRFIIELVDYIISYNIPVFIELMDKLFYLNTQLVEHVFLRYQSEELREVKNNLASNLTGRLDHDIYNKFIIACKSNSTEVLLSFYDTLIEYFTFTKDAELKNHIQYTKRDFLADFTKDGESVLKNYLPLPDENPHNKSIHFLTGFSAFTGILARAQKYSNDFLSGQFNIIHDMEEHHGIIYQSAFESMKTLKTDELVSDIISLKFETYNINKANNLYFQDSQSNIYLQVADLISGFVMRFWKDYKNGVADKVNLYAATMNKLTFPYRGTGTGTRFFTMNEDRRRFTTPLI